MHKHRKADQRHRQLEALGRHLGQLAIGIASPARSSGRPTEDALQIVVSGFLSEVGGLKPRELSKEERARLAEEDDWDE